MHRCCTFIQPCSSASARLYREDKRLPNWEVLEAHGVTGYLVLEWSEMRRYRTARLVDADGKDKLPMLIYAKIEQCKGPDGMLVEGIQPRTRGTKSAWREHQAWWCHAPPRTLPLRDMTTLKRKRIADGALGDWGEDGEDWPYPDDME